MNATQAIWSLAAGAGIGIAIVMGISAIDNIGVKIWLCFIS